MRARLALAGLLSAGVALAQGLWEERAPFPLLATEVSSAALDGRVYSLCGITPGNQSSNRLFVYDPAADAWAERAPLPIPLGVDHCNVATVGGKLYVVGAERIGRGFLSDRTLVYDPATDRWEQKSRMNIPRAASGVAVVGTKIYVAGGEGVERAGRAFEVYETETDRWLPLPDLPGTRTHLTAQAVGGKVYAIGGRIGGINDVRDSVFEYDPATNTWSAKAAMPTARGGLASGVIGGRIVVFGGEGPSGRPEATYDEVEEYDPAANAWRRLGPMPFPRHGFYGASTGDGRIYLPSGGPEAGATFSQRLDVFQAPPSEPPVFSAAGVVNAADFTSGLAPGSIAAIFGERLAVAEAAAAELPLPTRLGGAELRIGGRPAGLFYAGPGQINVLIPFDAPREGLWTLTNAGVNAPAVAVSLAEAAPALFTLDQSGAGQGAILIAGTGLPAGEGGRPARPGEAVEIFAAGLGPVTAPPAAGEPAGVDPLARTLLAVAARVGGREAEVVFAGLTPGLAGLYQVNALLADDIPSGDAVEVEIEVAGRVSNRVTLAIGAPE